MQAEGNTVILLSTDGQLAAIIAIADQIKPDAREAIERLRAAGLEPVMLTGDNAVTARAVADKVGIREYRADLLPGEKAEKVKELQREGHRVAMVGDGINDAPALMPGRRGNRYRRGNGHRHRVSGHRADWRAADGRGGRVPHCHQFLPEDGAKSLAGVCLQRHRRAARDNGPRASDLGDDRNGSQRQHCVDQLLRGATLAQSPAEVAA